MFGMLEGVVDGVAEVAGGFCGGTDGVGGLLRGRDEFDYGGLTGGGAEGKTFFKNYFFDVG